MREASDDVVQHSEASCSRGAAIVRRCRDSLLSTLTRGRRALYMSDSVVVDSRLCCVAAGCAVLQQLALFSRRVVAARVRNRNVTQVCAAPSKCASADERGERLRHWLRRLSPKSLAQTLSAQYGRSAVHTAVTADLAVQLGQRCFLRCEAGLSGHSRCEAAVARTSCGR